MKLPNNDHISFPFLLDSFATWAMPQLWDEKRVIRCRLLWFIALYTVAFAVNVYGFIVVILLLLVFVLSNTQRMPIEWFFYTNVFCVAFGVLIGISGWWEFVKECKKIKQQELEQQNLKATRKVHAEAIDYWHTIHSFNTTLDYEKFTIWLNDQIQQGIAIEQIAETQTSVIELFTVKHYKNTATNMCWRLVIPDATFKGLWELRENQSDSKVDSGYSKLMNNTLELLPNASSMPNH